MITPSRAAVRPRVRRKGGSGEAVLLEDEIRALLDQGQTGVVSVVGGAGWGKTTAIAHLAAVFAGDFRLVFFDPANAQHRWHSVVKPPDLMVHFGTAEYQPNLAAFHLAGWAEDDRIEYLRNRHPDRCVSVMLRVRTADCRLLGDDPLLWQGVLDEMAADPALCEVRPALLRCLDRALIDVNNPRFFGLLDARASNAIPTEPWPETMPDEFPEGSPERRAGRLLSRQAVMWLLSANRCVTFLTGPDVDRALPVIERMVGTEYLDEVGRCLKEEPRAIEYLRRVMSRRPTSHAALTLLHAAGIPWWACGTPSWTRGRKKRSGRAGRSFRTTCNIRACWHPRC